MSSIETDEYRANRARALVEERGGLEQRLARAKETGNADEEAKATERLAAVAADLKFYAGEGRPKSVRAEKRSG